MWHLVTLEYNKLIGLTTIVGFNFFLGFLLEKEGGL
jgi:hypothetical protein